MKDVCLRCGCLPVKGVENGMADDLLRDFFEGNTVEECAERLRDLLTAAMSSYEADVWDGVKRSNMIFFCHNLEKVLQAIEGKYKGNDQ